MSNQSNGHVDANLCEGIAESSTESLLDSISLETEASTRIDGVVVGILKSFDGKGTPIVDYFANESGEALQATSTLPLSEREIGKEVALLFEHGNPRKPMIIGLMWNSSRSIKPAFEVSKDEERIVLNAEREIVLRCGEASLTLTKAGKILLRGKYVLSRSSGVNRIKGGSVQIN